MDVGKSKKPDSWRKIMRKALVIGIGNIENRKLEGAINDANAIATTIATNGDGSPNFDVKLISDNKTLITKGVTILTASKDSESAVEINGHGVFTALLLQALSGGASDLH